MILLMSAAASGRAADTGVLTTVHLILIGILVVLTVVATAYGARLKRQRAVAEKASEERVEALEAEAAEAPPAPPAPAAAPPPATQAPSIAAAGDYQLSDVKGLGPKAVGLLAAQGVGDLATLAALNPERAAAVDGALGPLSGRLTRDRWVEQARLLAAGDRAGFEATFGKL